MHMHIIVSTRMHKQVQIWGIKGIEGIEDIKGIKSLEGIESTKGIKGTEGIKGRETSPFSYSILDAHIANNPKRTLIIQLMVFALQQISWL